MIRNTIRMAVVSILVSFASLVGLTAISAQAADRCGTIVDGANVLGNKSSKVQSAAESLQGAVNADVHVLTAPSLNGSATLDNFVDSWVQQCPSWQSPNGDRKSNLLVFAMTKSDRKVGIFYGQTWVNAFTGANTETRVYNDYMVPQFKTGDFGQGFVDGMRESQRVLNAFLHPSDNVGSQPSEQASGSGNGAIVTGLVIGGIVILVALAALVWWISSLMRRRREEEEERKKMRQRALSARDAATATLQDVGDASSMQAAARKARVAKYSNVSPSIKNKLDDALKDVNSHYTAATNGMAAAASASATSEDTDLTTGEYELMAERYEQVLEHAQAARDADQQIRQICDNVEQQLARAATSISDSETRLATLEGQLDELTKQGIKTDTIQESADQARHTLDNAKQHATDLAVLTDLGNVDEMLKHAEHALATLTTQRTDLAAGLPQLKGDIEHVQSLIPQTKECFDRISGEYTKSCWEAVAGNGTESEKRIQAAQQSLDQATSLAGLDVQQWNDATAMMQQGNQLITEAESLLQSIGALESHLAQARASAPQEIADAESDIDKASAYIQQYRGDVKGSHTEDLRAANATLTKAKDELSKDKPDYPRVIELALMANHNADNILAECTTEHEAAERLRRQAATTLQQAQAAVSKAKEYISDHHLDVRSGAKQNLDEAERYLDSAECSHDPKNVLEDATQASTMAEAAYEKAKRDHRKAEDKRKEGSTSNNDLVTGMVIGGVIGGSSSPGGGFGGFGGGSSGSFDGGGSGGGSSGSW